MLLKNGKVFLKNGFENADILIENDKIKDVGKISGTFDTILDLKGCYLVPGFVDLSSSIGLIEAGVKTEGNDLNEDNEECISHMHSIDGVNFEDRYFFDSLANGVTSAVITTGKSSVIGGISSLVKTNSVDFKGIIKKDVDINVIFGETPKKTFGGKLTPLSRMGILDIVRRNLLDAKNYKIKRSNGEINYKNYNPSLDSLVKVLDKEIPLKIYAQKKQDIECAINLKNEFDINIIINGGAESYKLVDLLRTNKVSVILGSCLMEKSFIELRERRNDTPKILNENKIPFTISSHHPDITMDLLHISMALACKFGLNEIDAIKALTIEPFKILGMDNIRGSLEKGKIADIAIFDGNPTYSLSKLIYTIIDGEIVYKNNIN